MNLFNFTGEQRVDTPDLTYATNTAMLGLQQDLTGNVLLAPGRMSIVSGFQPGAAASTGPVSVGVPGVANVAFLGERVGAQVTYGVLQAGDAAAQSVDITTFAAGTYTIYVCISRLPGTPQNRTFWSALDQTEQARLTDTLLEAGWQVRIESALPSPEWLAIGQAVITAGGQGQGNTVVVSDQRPMFFSGPQAAGGAPTWGTAADRSGPATGQLCDLQTTIEALKAAIVDVKGRGLASWWQPNVVGLQVGSGFGLASQPLANTLQVGDAGLALSLNGATATAALMLDGGNDGLALNRTTGVLSRARGGTTLLSQDAQGDTALAGTLFAQSNGPGCVLQGTSQSSTYGAYLGLYAPQAKRAGVDVGTGYGALGYFDIVVDWTQSPTCTFSTQGRAFVTTTVASNALTTQVNGNQLTLSSSGNRLDLNPSALYFNGRQVPQAMLLWSSGVYQPGSTNSDQVPVTGVVANPVGVVPTAVYQTDAGGHHSIQMTFPQSFPSAATFLVSGAYDNTTGKVYQCGYRVLSGNTLVVGIANGADDPVNIGFTFYVLYGS